MVMFPHMLTAANVDAIPPDATSAGIGLWLVTTAFVAVTRFGCAKVKSAVVQAVRTLPGIIVVDRETQSFAAKLAILAPQDQEQQSRRLQITRRLLGLTAFAFGLGIALPTVAQTITGSSLNVTGQSALQGDVLMCSGRPWIDVRCYGATGDGSHDDTTAINTAISTAITNNWPVHLPAGTYKITSVITIDYAGQASKGFRLISEAAIIDGRAIASGPVLQIQCGGGTIASPTGCFYFKEEGTLFVNANTSAYAVVLGKTDFSDAHNSAKSTI
jgi:Pectate lyase superfamily protein